MTNVAKNSCARHPVKVIVASPRGYCAGVHMAVTSLNLALDRFPPPVYVFHQIVHNRPLIEDFESRGVIFVEQLDEVPDGCVLLFSAHGVSPAVREESKRKRLRVIDATCPLVTKVHREANTFASQGYTVALIGHVGHDEVVGVQGEAPERIRVIENEADIAALPTDLQKVAYVTQTTLAVDDAAQLVTSLGARFPLLHGPAKDDICYATQNRQDAIKKLAAEVEVAIIIGSENSSNTLRLADVAACHGLRVHRIDNASEVREDWFDGVSSILVTAGASVPEFLVEDLLCWLRTHLEVEVSERIIERELQTFALPPGLICDEPPMRGIANA
jgi:4-hydroxy-3-methylbut-2-en-1-yl diphosphate reductase